MQKISVKIEITPEDIELATKYAKLRNAPMKNCKSIVSKDLDLKYHISGCIGEIAARKYYHMPLELPVNTFKNQPDILLDDGTWVEVKSSRTGWFNCKINEPDNQQTLLISYFEQQGYCLILCTLPMEIFKSICKKYGSNNYWDNGDLNGWRIKYSTLKLFA